jgi:hypothetical protein
MIVLKIDVMKIDPKLLFLGKNGAKYLDAALVDKPNDFGDDGFISQSPSKEDRAKGVKGTIIGNWRHVGGSAKQKPSEPKPAATKPKTEGSPANDGTGLPF